MAKVLYQKTGDGELEKIMASMEDGDKAEIKRLFGEFTETDMGEAVDTIARLADKYPDNDDLKMLLAKEYFITSEFDIAEKLYRELAKKNPKDPEIHAEIGKTYTARGEYHKAIAEYEKAEKSDAFLPYYYGMYARTLDEVGNEKRARELYHKEIEHLITAGDMYDEVFLDGCYQQIIELDVRIGSAELKADVEAYKDFLQKMSSTDQIRDHLSDLIVGLSQMLGNKWIRNIFMDFVKHVDEKGYLKEYPNCITISSAYTSYESWLYNEDPEIGKVVYTFLKSSAIVDIENDPEYEEMEEDLPEKITFVTYKWIICHEYETLKNQLLRVKELYPHTYRRFGDLIEQIESRDRSELLAELEKECVEVGEVNNPEKLHGELEAFVKIQMKDTQRTTIVTNGAGPYRNKNKILPNDPCPCGSGKKYKKCCGR